MVEGFWTVQFLGPQGNGGGVAVFVKGKMFGGDSGFSYIGTYEGDPVLKARVLVQQFDAGIPNVLGMAGDFELNVTATVKGDTMAGTAIVAGQPQRSLGIKLVKKADL
jgi:hypothetical protein